MEISKEEIKRLLDDLASANGKVEKEGKERLERISRIHRELSEFLAESEEMVERAVGIEKEDVSTRIKFSRKVMAFVKRLDRVWAEVTALFREKKIQKKDGEAFENAIISMKKMKKEKLENARRELEKLEPFIAISRKKDETENEIEETRKSLERELDRIKLEEGRISDFEKMKTIDGSLLERYSHIKGQMKKYEEWRKGRIEKLKGQPLLSIAKAVAKEPTLMDALKPAEESLSKLVSFLEERRELASLTPSKALEMLDYNEKKLGHHISDAHRFKGILEDNRGWIKRMEELEKSDFLAIKIGEEKSIARALSLAERIGDREIAGILNGLRAVSFENALRMREEGERKARFEEMKKEIDIGKKEKLSERKEEIRELLSMLG